MKLKINSDRVKAFLKERGLSYQDVEERTNRRISVYSLKYYLNQDAMIPENLAMVLAELLDCNLDSILDSAFIRTSGLPMIVHQMLKGLYSPTKEAINVTYDRLMADRAGTKGFQNLLAQTSKLNEILTRPALEDQIEESTMLAISCILQLFVQGKPLFSTQLNLGIRELEYFNSLILLSGPDYRFIHSGLLFLYSLCLFEALFVDEMIATSIQVSIDRRQKVVNEFFILATQVEKLKDRYLDTFLNDGAPKQLPPGYAEMLSKILFQNSQLLISACFLCRQHLEGNFVRSELLNRKVVGALIVHLIKTSKQLEIEIPEPNLEDFATSRFGQVYLKYRAIKDALESNKPQPQKMATDPYCK